MKIIKYKIGTEVNQGTSEIPDIQMTFIPVEMPYSDKNILVAKDEAYNGEYEIIDDGQPEPSPAATEQLRYDVDELKEALNMILTGVTE